MASAYFSLQAENRRGITDVQTSRRWRMHQPTSTPACKCTPAIPFTSSTPATTDIYYPQRAQKKKQKKLFCSACEAMPGIHSTYFVRGEKTKPKKKHGLIFLKTMQCAVFPEFMCSRRCERSNSQQFAHLSAFWWMGGKFFQLSLLRAKEFALLWGCFCKHTMWGWWEAPSPPLLFGIGLPVLVKGEGRSKSPRIPWN